MSRPPSPFALFRLAAFLALAAALFSPTEIGDLPPEALFLEADDEAPPLAPEETGRPHLLARTSDTLEGAEVAHDTVPAFGLLSGPAFLAGPRPASSPLHPVGADRERDPSLARDDSERGPPPVA